MKKASYLIVVALAAIGLLQEVISLLSAMKDISSIWLTPDIWYDMTGRFFRIGLIIVFLIFTLLQLMKFMPKRTLFFGGIMIFDSALLLFSKQQYGLFLLSAGALLAAVQIFRILKETGQGRQVHEGRNVLLILSALLAFISAALSIVTIVIEVSSLARLGFAYPLSVYTWIYALYVFDAAWAISLGLLCLKKKWSLIKPLRILLCAPYVIGLLRLPALILYLFSSTFIPVLYYFELPVNAALGILMLVYIIRTKKDDLLPQNQQGIDMQTDPQPTGGVQF